MQRLVEHYKIPQEIIDIWSQEEGPQLLDVQAIATEQFGLLDGKSLLITAPSSSGKTFVGELAAVNAYYKGQRSIYLVPMKAIAEEKYVDFKRKYEGFGIHVTISTRDRIADDSAILAGHFDIAIIIFEKMNVLLTQQPAMLNGCGLVVVDEVQLINEPHRGPALEILLTKIKMLKERAESPLQFVCLSGVLGDVNRFDEWLGAKRCDVKTRPLELHEGVLMPDGRINMRTFNSGVTSQETISGISVIPVPSTRDFFLLEPSVKQRLAVLCKHYLEIGKRVLVFRKWKTLARETASDLARQLALPAATQVIQDLRDVEDTNSKETLVECLAGGVAFHNSDLTPESRLAIERHFRDPKGQVQVVCSTSTLAMGVNLPASVVIIADTDKPDSNSEEFHEVPLTASEYKNMAGRAGRTRFQEEGHSIVLANSPAQGTLFWRNYVLGTLDSVQSALHKSDLRKIILGIVSGGICESEEDLVSVLLSSYSGFLHWNESPASRSAFTTRIHENVEYLVAHQLLQDNGVLTATGRGKLCATSGVEIESFVVLQDILDRIDVTNWHVWEVIFPCLHAQELEDNLRINMKIPKGTDATYFRALEDADPTHRLTLLEWSRGACRRPDGVVRRVCAYLMLSDWIEGVEMPEIETKYRLSNRYLSGVIQGIGETTAWLVQTLSKIAAASEYPDDFVAELNVLSERLERGVPARGADLHRLKVKGLTRPLIRRLVDAGFWSTGSVLDTEPKDFRGIISPQLAGRIQDAIVQHFDESLGRSRYVHISRLQKLGHDTEPIRRLYEAEGIPLEDAIVELLNTPPLSLGARRVGTQREGEPDILLPTDFGLLVGSVTASSKPITDTKCVEIVRSGARLNANAYAVFGRPSFHELAVRNAISVSGQLGVGKTYKLISIQDLAELFVRVVESSLSKEQFITTLMHTVGLVNLPVQGVHDATR